MKQITASVILFSRLERVILGQFHRRGQIAVLKQHLWTSKSSTVDLGRNVQAVLLIPQVLRKISSVAKYSYEDMHLDVHNKAVCSL